MGGPCVGGQQQCCNAQTTSRRVCRRVPYTVKEQVTIPGYPGTFMIYREVFTSLDIILICKTM